MFEMGTTDKTGGTRGLGGGRLVGREEAGASDHPARPRGRAGAAVFGFLPCFFNGDEIHTT